MVGQLLNELSFLGYSSREEVQINELQTTVDPYLEHYHTYRHSYSGACRQLAKFCAAGSFGHEATLSESSEMKSPPIFLRFCLSK